MKKLILLSILLIGCNKTTTSTPSCTELIKTYTDAASAFSADNANLELCDASMTAYLAVIDAECTGYTDLSQAQINLIGTMCDYFTETEAVYGCTDPDASNYAPNATTPCNSGTDNDCCVEEIVGCVDASASNYNPLATVDNGNCEYTPIDCAGVAGGNAVIDECGVCNGDASSCDQPISFSYNQSTAQGMYYFNVVTIDGVSVSPSDLVGAFKNDVCVGVRQWDTSQCSSGICDLVIMGNDGSDGTEGYMMTGEIPSFKIYDASKNIVYDAVASKNTPWEYFGFNTIESLNATSSP